jgi:hypothetical protein
VKEREVQAHFVELAVGISREPPQGGEADSIRSWATGILSKYSGVTMSRGAQQALQHTTPLPDNRSERAAMLERLGFEALLAGNLDSAINTFQAAEAAYPTFHQVYEIARYLDSQHRTFQLDPGRVYRYVRDSSLMVCLRKSKGSSRVLQPANGTDRYFVALLSRFRTCRCCLMWSRLSGGTEARCRFQYPRAYTVGRR